MVVCPLLTVYTGGTKQKTEKENYMKTLIVTGGTVDSAFAASYLRQQAFDDLIACDRGIHFFAQKNIRPDAIIGDFDSADQDELSRFRGDPAIAFHTFQPEKDYADTELALKLAIARGGSEVHILGGTGTRLDHVLGTVRMLGIALESNVMCYLVDVNNRLRLIRGRTVIKKAEQYGRYISFIPLTNEVRGVTLSGFYYPLSDYTMGGFHTLGISNEIVEEEAVVDLRDGILIMVEASD